jgi:hypothetical protein
VTDKGEDWLVRRHSAEPELDGLRLTDMRVRLCAVLIGAALVAAGCGGSSSGSGGGTSGGAGSGGVKASGEIRATRIPSFLCPSNTNNSAGSGASLSIAPADLTRMQLCPLSTVQQQGVAVTLTPSDPAFAKITTSLALPDQKSVAGQACAAYATLPQIVIGQTSSGAVLLHIPTDGCGHYLSQALTALTDARSAATTTPAN